jgi:hypothetical protein
MKSQTFTNFGDTLTIVKKNVLGWSWVIYVEEHTC